MSQPRDNEQQLETLWKDASHWRFGILYYAPAAPRVFVPKRGRGWAHQTLHWARPASWALAGSSILPLLLVTALALWARG